MSRLRALLTSEIRIGLSVFVIVALLFGLPGEFTQRTRYLIAFDAGAGVFLGLLLVAVTGATTDEIRAHARHSHGSRTRLLAGSLLACVSSLVAVGFALRSSSADRVAYRTDLILSTLTVFAAWLVLQTVFGLYYARCYYQPARGATHAADGDEKGLQFAGGEPPDYWDFFYAAFTIGACYSTSDTTITSRPLRRAALLQMFVSFVFYTFLVGMVINAIGALFGA
jgi:uncharacterized membrane protein